MLGRCLPAPTDHQKQRGRSGRLLDKVYRSFPYHIRKAGVTPYSQVVVAAVETENNLDVKQFIARKEKHFISRLQCQMNISLAVRRLAGFLNVRQIGERAFTDLWILGGSLHFLLQVRIGTH